MWLDEPGKPAGPCMSVIGAACRVVAYKTGSKADWLLEVEQHQDAARLPAGASTRHRTCSPTCWCMGGTTMGAAWVQPAACALHGVPAPPVITFTETNKPGWPSTHKLPISTGLPACTAGPNSCQTHAQVCSRSPALHAASGLGPRVHQRHRLPDSAELGQHQRAVHPQLHRLLPNGPRRLHAWQRVHRAPSAGPGGASSCPALQLHRGCAAPDCAGAGAGRVLCARGVCWRCQAWVAV